MGNVREYRNVVQEKEVQEETTCAGLVTIGMCVEDQDSAILPQSFNMGERPVVDSYCLWTTFTCANLHLD